MAGRDRCEEKKPTEGGKYVFTRRCVYNGCRGCYSEYAGSAELDQDCTDYYSNVNYQCCGRTPDTCYQQAVSWKSFKSQLLDRFPPN